MVNPRVIFHKSGEAKKFIDEAQEFVIKKTQEKKTKKKEPSLFEDKNITKEKSLKESVKTKVKEKTLPPVSKDSAERMLFTKDNKIKPTKLKDFNIGKIETRDDILKFIDEISVQFKSSINIQKRGVQTNEATKEMAALLQVNSGDLKNALLNIKPGQTLNAETILAARELLLAAMNRLDELAVVAKNGGKDDLMAFRQHMALTSELQKIIKGVQTETGRALQQFKIPVRDTKFTATHIDELNRNQLLLELGGEDAVRNMAATYLKADTAKARAMFTDRAGLVTKSQEALAEIFINAILSNPLTHVRNTAGNWITQGILMQERKFASRFLSGKIDEVDRANVGIAEFEDVAKAYGKAMASQEMFAAIGRSLSEGKLPQIKNQISGSKIEIRPNKFSSEHFGLKEGGVANGVDILGRILTLDRIPTKLLSFSDNYFKNLEYRSEIYALAYRETLDLIKQGKLPKEKAAEFLADRVVNPPAAHVEKAYEMTLTSVFQNKLGTRGDFLDFGNYLQKAKSKSGWLTFMSNYYLPFIQTPTNVTGMVLERTPGLNLLLTRYRNDILGHNGLAAQQLAKSKMALGSLFYTTVMGMTFGGMATGTSPEIGMNYKNKYNKTEMKKLFNIQPGTINIPYGDTTLQINLTGNDPIAMAFRQAADMAAIAMHGFEDNDQAADYMNYLAALTLSLGENISSSTFMAGIGKAVNDYQNYKTLGFEKGFEKQSKQIISSFVPTGARQVFKLVNEDNNKIAITINEYIQKSLYDKKLPKDYDILGSEIERFGLISFRKEDPVRNELLRTGVEIKGVDRLFKHTDSDSGVTSNIEYTSDELSFYKKRSGDYAYQALEALFQTDEYNAEDVDNIFKQQWIKNVFTQSRAAAKGDMLFNQDENSDDYEEYPEYLIDEDWLTIKGLGPYENSMDLQSRIKTKTKENLMFEIQKMNMGKPVQTDFETYFNEGEQ
jgi:hypothetical protein